MEVLPTDIKNEVIFSGQFQPYVDTLDVPIPQTDIDRLKEIRLRFWIQPTRDADALVSVHDMRVALHDTGNPDFKLDLTQPITDVLASNLSQSAGFNDQYARCLEERFAFLSAMVPPRTQDLLRRMTKRRNG